MICRIWRGWTTRENADAYESVVRTQVIPEIERMKIDGFRHIDLLRRADDQGFEFMTIMWFDNIDAVKRFTGDDYAVSYVPAAGQAVLARFDTRSAHYDVLDRRQQPARSAP
jgi:heme-degrading monooxygenase HmoA